MSCHLINAIKTSGIRSGLIVIQPTKSNIDLQYKIRVSGWSCFSLPFFVAKMFCASITLFSDIIHAYEHYMYKAISNRIKNYMDKLSGLKCIFFFLIPGAYLHFNISCGLIFHIVIFEYRTEDW